LHRDEVLAIEAGWRRAPTGRLFERTLADSSSWGALRGFHQNWLRDERIVFVIGSASGP
jgi:hypothetical protein